MRFDASNMTEDIHITDSISLILDEDAPSMLNDAFNSPSSSLFRRPSASPIGNRERRPDLFGSPKSPLTRSGGAPPTLLSRMNSESDLTDYLPTLDSRKRRNIFDEDENDEDEEETDTPNIPAETYSDDDSMVITQTIPAQTYSDDESMVITQTIPAESYSDDESMVITQTIPAESYSDDESMLITQEQIISKSPVRTPQSRTPQRTPQRTPTRTPNRSTLRASLGTPPRATLVTVHKTPAKSPLRTPLRNPVRTPLRNPVRTPLRTALRHSLNTPQRVIAPSTSTYLSSPLRSTTTSRKLPAASPRSFYLHTGQSMESDRMTAFHEDVPDVLQESPRYYDAHDEVIVNEPKMSLSDFLMRARITFPQDFPTNDTVLDPIYDTSVTEDQDISSSTVLPEIQLYQQACKQLIASIKISDEIITSIDKDISQVNPQLFIEFMDGTAETQAKIQRQLQDIKDYSMLRSKQEWLALWSNSLKEFPSTLRDLKNKLDVYREFEQMIGDKLVELNQYHVALSGVLNDYRQKEQNYHSIDHHQLRMLLIEIENQDLFYQDLKKNADDLEKHLQKLEEEDQALEAEISELTKLLKEAEETIEQNQCITTRDLIDAKKEYGQLSEMFGWKVKQMDETIFHLEIDDGIDIIVDLNKLSDHDADAVFCRLSLSKEKELGPFIELLQGFEMVTKDKWDMIVIVQEIATYWNRVRMILRAIELVQRRSWVKITALEDMDPNQAGFSCQICLFNFEGKSKSIITFEYRVKDFLIFPDLDFSTLHLEVCYGSMEHDALKSLLIQELKKDGILNMAESLQSVLKLTLVSSEI
ncbi:Spc7 kinetochore protein-domain-containing protein [Thamnidium elegans]|nr:Spc7 kinetochore protein-domain-containing protein [Thamnidium elegans]